MLPARPRSAQAATPRPPASRAGSRSPGTRTRPESPSPGRPPDPRSAPSAGRRPAARRLAPRRRPRPATGAPPPTRWPGRTAPAAATAPRLGRRAPGSRSAPPGTPGAARRGGRCRTASCHPIRASRAVLRRPGRAPPGRPGRPASPLRPARGGGAPPSRHCRTFGCRQTVSASRSNCSSLARSPNRDRIAAMSAMNIDSVGIATSSLRSRIRRSMVVPDRSQPTMKKGRTPQTYRERSRYRWRGPVTTSSFGPAVATVEYQPSGKCQTLRPVRGSNAHRLPLLPLAPCDATYT